MNGASDQLFAGSGFSEDQHSSVARGREFDLSQGPSDRGTFADNFLEIKFAADFFFEIELFDREFIFEGIDFPEGQRIFDGDGNLRRDAIQKVRVAIRKSIETAAGKI